MIRDSSFIYVPAVLIPSKFQNIIGEVGSSEKDVL